MCTLSEESYTYRLVHPLSKKTLMILATTLIDTYMYMHMYRGEWASPRAARRCSGESKSVQGGRSLEGVLPAAEGGERQDPL